MGALVEKCGADDRIERQVLNQLSVVRVAPFQVL